MTIDWLFFRLDNFDYSLGAVCKLHDVKHDHDENEGSFSTWANCPAPPIPVSDLTACEPETEKGVLFLNWTATEDKAGRPGIIYCYG